MDSSQISQNYKDHQVVCASGPNQYASVKSNMADGSDFENPKIMISAKPIG